MIKQGCVTCWDDKISFLINKCHGKDQESYKWILPINFSNFRSSCKCSDPLDGIGTSVASQIGPFHLSKSTQVC